MQHLKTLRGLNFVAAALFGIVGLLVLLLFLLPFDTGIDVEIPLLRIRLIGLLSSLLILGVAASHLLVGWLVGAHRGRVLQSFLALVHLTSFPVGTAYAAYALWLCWIHEPTRKAFESSLKPPIS